MTVQVEPSTNTRCPFNGPGLLVSCSSVMGRGTVTLDGELDLYTVAELDHALRALWEQGDRHVVLDLSGLSFMAAVGIRMISRAATDSASAGGSLTLLNPTSFVRRLLTMSGHGHLISASHPVASRVVYGSVPR